ncbi:ABC transporter substrate-binding protein [Ponticoccus sp. SC2-23]|uniref:ABC transporter substrate-binding protein n=1 Tax=Alexandriicola marinus TaxID=2081710 RepID=UPI000FD9EA73|nr:ABC transporter substrate-binding protein [Alexandriicola marinus]MBM1218647.1 ABC transporter substrate-binding protein [Ponticoccus sp. SC6-9]MBM1224281.1 ABC transporter substrate-binding protein [Ponticoccus sp. SC6-15]MBM1229940.1 ABC transporter substrate-binding protein [Ponticoccus sp. SC6-38]MBM1233247.1 ABC transporter substrate-binding protein [Ponticoccus sp. SC6-45]MBM1236803.1 ABC transporter substrate-binding protein [Ponticoccus sp. SC6-49]MBM1242258.1 ABC transporter subst
MKRRDFNKLLAMAAGVALPARAFGFSPPAKEVVVGVQLTGTASWEMQTILDKRLDAHNEIRLELMDVANKQAGHVALLSGEADLILSDYIWVASLRAAGEPVTCVPHSLAVGGLMVPAGSDIGSVADLPGRTIGIAGGPVDKSWIALQAYYGQLTGDTLADKVDAKFGAPPLINELLANGEVDASLNFWHFNARAKAAGHSELISVAQMMEGMGITNQPPLLAWVFLEETAEKKDDVLTHFFDASFEAKELLASDDAIWEGLREQMRATDNDALFHALRDDYRAGIIPGYSDEMIDAAATAFAIMAEYGGPDLVGDSTTMDPGTFWAGYRA